MLSEISFFNIEERISVIEGRRDIGNALLECAVNVDCVKSHYYHVEDDKSPCITKEDYITLIYEGKYAPKGENAYATPASSDEAQKEFKDSLKRPKGKVLVESVKQKKEWSLDDPVKYRNSDVFKH